MLSLLVPFRAALTHRMTTFVMLAFVSGMAQANTFFEWMEAAPKIVANSPRNQLDRANVMADLAAFNALNAITPRFESYGPALAPVPDASADAAVAAVMQIIFTNLPGIDAAALDKTYQEQIKKVTDASARRKGILLGKRAAQAMLAMRVEDDFTRIEPTKRELAPGVFELTPDRKMSSSNALIKTRPYGIARMEDFDPGMPLEPGSAAAKRDVAEVKLLGGNSSTIRTGDQTAAAIFWNSGEPNDSLTLFKTIAEKRNMPMLDAVRMIAMLDMAEYDGRIVYVTFKDKYSYWRPYNAIRGKFADADVRDAQWEPLLQTPANPDYPSGSGVAGGSMAQFFETFNGDNAVPLTWKNSAIGVTRSWPNGQALGRELGYSRLWAGVHFRHSIEVGHKVGENIFDVIYATQLKPLANKPR